MLFRSCLCVLPWASLRAFVPLLPWRDQHAAVETMGPGCIHVELFPQLRGGPLTVKKGGRSHKLRGWICVSGLLNQTGNCGGVQTCRLARVAAPREQLMIRDTGRHQLGTDAAEDISILPSGWHWGGFYTLSTGEGFLQLQAPRHLGAGQEWRRGPHPRPAESESAFEQEPPPQSCSHVFNRNLISLICSMLICPG